MVSGESSWVRSERHVATLKTGLPHAPTRGFGAPVFGLASIKIEIENSLEMALSKAKSGSAWQSHFWQLEPCDLLETRSSLHYANKSKLGFV